MHRVGTSSKRAGYFDAFLVGLVVRGIEGALVAHGPSWLAILFGLPAFCVLAPGSTACLESISFDFGSDFWKVLLEVNEEGHVGAFSLMAGASAAPSLLSSDTTPVLFIAVIHYIFLRGCLRKSEMES